MKKFDEILKNRLNEGDVSDLGEAPEPPAEDKNEEAEVLDPAMQELADDLADALVDAMATVLGGGDVAPEAGGDDLDQVDSLLKDEPGDDVPPPAPGGDEGGDDEEIVPPQEDGPPEADDAVVDPDITEAPGGGDEGGDEGDGDNPLQDKVDSLESENAQLKAKIASLTKNEDLDLGAGGEVVKKVDEEDEDPEAAPGSPEEKKEDGDEIPEDLNLEDENDYR